MLSPNPDAAIGSVRVRMLVVFVGVLPVYVLDQPPWHGLSG